MTSKTFQKGDTIDWVNDSGDDVASDDIVVIGGALLGIALADIADGATGPVAIRGVYSAPKVSGAVIAQGESMSFDVSTGEFDDNLAAPDEGDITGPGATAFESAGAGVVRLRVLFNAVAGLIAPAPTPAPTPAPP